MQAKLGAAFLLVALLYVLIGWLEPRLQPNPLSGIIVTASSYLVIGLAAAWFMSRLLGCREIVVRPLGGPLRELRTYSGAALLEDGAIALVLDPEHLPHAPAASRR